MGKQQTTALNQKKIGGKGDDRATNTPENDHPGASVGQAQHQGHRHHVVLSLRLGSET